MENQRCLDEFSDFTKMFAFEEHSGMFSNGGKDFTSLSFEDFREIVNRVLTDDKSMPADVPGEMSLSLFKVLDTNCDGRIDDSEFRNFLHEFVRPLTKPIAALLVIDMQNDFVDGSLALKSCPARQDANSIIPTINNLVENSKFDVVAYTLDYHPPSHISFYDNLKLRKLSKKNKNVEEICLFDTVVFEGQLNVEQKLWPVHCVQGTCGSNLHKDLIVKKDSLFIHKGQNPSVDSYSAFYDNSKLSCTPLSDELRKRDVTHVLVCGVALDYCVAFTALDAIRLGYPTVIIEDASVGTDIENIKCMKEKLMHHNCVFTNSENIASFISGKIRRVEFASILLEKLKKSLLIRCDSSVD